MRRAPVCRAEVYALMAAAMNGSIGTLTRVVLAKGVSHHQIAFMKCFLAFLVVLAFSLARDGGWQSVVVLRGKWKHFVLLSFLGILFRYFLSPRSLSPSRQDPTTYKCWRAESVKAVGRD